MIGFCPFKISIFQGVASLVMKVLKGLRVVKVKPFFSLYGFQEYFLRKPELSTSSQPTWKTFAKYA